MKIPTKEITIKGVTMVVNADDPRESDTPKATKKREPLKRASKD